MADSKMEQDAAAKERSAKLLCVATGIFMAGVTMVVPTRAPMVMQIKKGDAAATAKAMGLMSTVAAVIELVVNPILGKMSDQYGRRPFMTLATIINATLHSFVALLPDSLPMQFIDRMISGSMIFGFLAPCQAAMADLYGSDPKQLGVWSARMGTFLGVGTTLGPFIGSKLGGAKSFLGSAMTFLLAMLFVQSQLPETLAESLRKTFKLSDVNPTAFTKLFKDRMLGKLAITTALQSFGDYVNIYDINNLFMIKNLGFGTAEIGNFAMAVGLTQIAGGKISTEVVQQYGLDVSALLANTLWAIGMTTMGTAKNGTRAIMALCLWTFGHQRNNSVAAYMQKYGAKQGLGRGEIIAATGNFNAWVKIFIPLVYSNLFAWATSNGRNMPGLPYFLIATLTALAQLQLWEAAPKTD